jgi:metallo-beta-lactamase class B
MPAALCPSNALPGQRSWPVPATATYSDAEVFAISAFGDKFPYEPVVDRAVGDGDRLSVGVTLTVVMIPGHTKACSAWRMTVRDGGKRLSVLFIGSVTSPGYSFYENKQYPGIIADYKATFARLKTLKPDVFLGSHGSFFDLSDKIEKLRTRPTTNPFIEDRTYTRYLGNNENQFYEKLKQQKSGN